MLTYPVHQAADILFCKGTWCRWAGTSCRTWSSPGRSRAGSTSGTEPVFPMPDALLGRAAAARHRRPQDEQEPRQHDRAARQRRRDRPAIRGAKTDSERYISYDPASGGPSRPAWSCWPRCAWAATRGGRGRHRRRRGRGAEDACVTSAVNDLLAPIRARRAEYARDLGYVRQVLRDGNERANEIAAATLAEVQGVMGMRYWSRPAQAGHAQPGAP